MRIVFLVHSLSMGGAERVTVTLANHWSKSNHDVLVVTTAPTSEDRYALDPNVRRVSLSLAGKSGSVLDAIVQNMRRVLAVRKLLARELPDVAIGVMSTSSILLAIAGVGLKLRLIGTEHIHPPKLPLGRSWEWLRRNCYGALGIVVALTERSAEWLRANTRAKRVVVIGNPVAFPLPATEPVISPAVVHGAEQRSKVLLCVGRLAPQKRFDIAIEAFGSLASRYPRWILVILGEGELRGELEAKIRRLALTNRVLMPGQVGNLADWYQSADLFALTSSFEGYPNTLLEAMSYGLGAVSVDCDTGPREIIQDGSNGVLVPQGNRVALIAALEKCMVDDAFRAHIGRNAISVRGRFSMEAVTAKWESEFSRIGAI